MMGLRSAAKKTLKRTRGGGADRRWEHRCEGETVGVVVGLGVLRPGALLWNVWFMLRPGVHYYSGASDSNTLLVLSFRLCVFIILVFCVCG